jgi:hypothetical protein
MDRFRIDFKKNGEGRRLSGCRWPISGVRGFQIRQVTSAFGLTASAKTEVSEARILLITILLTG